MCGLLCSVGFQPLCQGIAPAAGFSSQSSAPAPYRLYFSPYAQLLIMEQNRGKAFDWQLYSFQNHCLFCDFPDNCLRQQGVTCCAMEVRFSCTPQHSSTPMSKDKMSEVSPWTQISFFNKVLFVCWGSPSQFPSFLPPWVQGWGCCCSSLQIKHLPKVIVQGAAVSNTETKGCKSQVPFSTDMIGKSENVSNASNSC